MARQHSTSKNKSGMVLAIVLLVAGLGGLVAFALYKQREANQLEKDMDSLKKLAEQGKANSDLLLEMAGNKDEARGGNGEETKEDPRKQTVKGLDSVTQKTTLDSRNKGAAATLEISDDTVAKIRNTKLTDVKNSSLATLSSVQKQTLAHRVQSLL